MKRHFILTAVAAAMLLAACGGNAIAATDPPKGSTNTIAQPPGQSSKGALTVVHPTQAGVVTKTISGNFVRGAARSWITKGNVTDSLCILRKTGKVSCAPLASAAVMAGIDVTASAGKNGHTQLTFTPSATTKRSSYEQAIAAGFFMQRIAKTSAHFVRMEVSHAPRPGEMGLSMADDVGGACAPYDDHGEYSCGGGSGGGTGGGGGEGGGGNEGNYPSDPPAPPVDLNDPNMPVVVIVGERPESRDLRPPPQYSQLPIPELIEHIPTNTSQVRTFPLAACRARAA